LLKNLDDCPNIISKIIKTKLDDKSLIALLKNYNQVVCNNYLVFEDKTRKINVNLGISYSVLQSQLYLNNGIPENTGLSSANVVGLTVNLSNLPVLSPKFSLQTGIGYYTSVYYYYIPAGVMFRVTDTNRFFTRAIESGNHKLCDFKVLRVPLTLHYSLLTGKIQPYISAGISTLFRISMNVPNPNLITYTSNYGYDNYRITDNYQYALNTSVGVNYLILKKLGLGIDLNYEHAFGFFGRIYGNDPSYSRNLYLQFNLCYRINNNKVK
jgi:hypothetical protein